MKSIINQVSNLYTESPSIEYWPFLYKPLFSGGPCQWGQNGRAVMRQDSRIGLFDD